MRQRAVTRAPQSQSITPDVEHLVAWQPAQSLSEALSNFNVNSCHNAAWGLMPITKSRVCQRYFTILLAATMSTSLGLHSWRLSSFTE